VGRKSQLSVRLKQSKFFVSGFILFLFIVTLSIISPFIVAFDAQKNSLSESLTPPQFFFNGWSGHILGTDDLGRDVLTRILIGSRYTLSISFIVVFFIIIIGTVAGLYSGYYGGWLDNLIMRFADIQLSIPTLLLAIAIVAVLGPSIPNLIIVLIITGWAQIARIVRGEVLGIKKSDFISASKVLGSSDSRIIFYQILPNVANTLLIVGSQRMGLMMMMEAYLSFLGLGIQPPIPSWGLMISDGRQFLMMAPWITLAPGIALMLAVLAFNFIGDGLRDAFDPKMKT